MIWDFNWKSACDKSLCAQWSVASNIKSVKSGTVAPIRCVNEGASAEFAASHDILGIPHHLAMVYAVAEFEWQPATAFRLRRCGKVVWAIKPNLYENARLRASAGEAARRVGYTTSLLEAWSTWHARAGDVCNAAANFGLAEQICKPERAKGTAPSTRAVAEEARDASDDSIAMRRIKRLRRACVDQVDIGRSRQSYSRVGRAQRRQPHH